MPFVRVYYKIKLLYCCEIWANNYLDELESDSTPIEIPNCRIYSPNGVKR